MLARRAASCVTLAPGLQRDLDRFEQRLVAGGAPYRGYPIAAANAGPARQRLRRGRSHCARGSRAAEDIRSHVPPKLVVQLRAGRSRASHARGCRDADAGLSGHERCRRRRSCTGSRTDDDGAGARRAGGTRTGAELPRRRSREMGDARVRRIRTPPKRWRTPWKATAGAAPTRRRRASSRTAFQTLHRLFPKSEWARRTRVLVLGIGGWGLGGEGSGTRGK